MEFSGEIHAQAALPLAKNPVPIEWESGWAKGTYHYYISTPEY